MLELLLILALVNLIVPLLLMRPPTAARP